MASDIPHPQAFVHNFLEALDIICNIGQNKNTLGAAVISLARIIQFSYNYFLRTGVPPELE